MENAIQFLFPFLILIFSVVIHEVAHGYAALALGDTTAKDAGRLTLNPIPHVDPFGSVLLPLILVLTQSPVLIGWAKPVPYNPYNLRDPFGKLGAGKNWGPAIVGAAGPLANIAMALAFGLILRALPLAGASFAFSTLANLSSIISGIVLLNLALAVFNLVPIPPLDGSKVLFALLPYQWRGIETFLEQYGFFLLLIFILFFSQWIFPVVLFFFRIVAGNSLFL